MFSTTHDAILLVIAALYLVVGIARLVLHNPPPRAIAWFSAPFWMAATLVVVAILW